MPSGPRSDLALATTELRVSFGGVHAVDGLSARVRTGSIHGIIGPNGSGKSTVLNAMTGLVPYTGTIELLGTDVRGMSAGAIRRLGVVRSFQTPQVVGELTCEENVLTGSSDRRGYGLAAAWPLRLWSNRVERERCVVAQRCVVARRALESVRLTAQRDTPASELSYGNVRRLELARAVAGEPRLMLLDEPSAGLNEAETAALGELLLGMRDPDRALIVVDHKVDLLDRICDEITVLEQGRHVASGPPAAVWADEQVVRAYLGRPREQA
jgi:ABC-type branched-subunit amino acid transport system ATPase component